MTSIFIEGKENVFIESLLAHLGYNESNSSFEFVKVWGWTNLPKVINKFVDNQIKGNRNVVIFDADTESNDGGFQKRLNEIQQILDDNSVIGEIFLFPNHGTDGDYESLLIEVINTNNDLLLSCFDKYEDCISARKKDDGSNMYITPSRKSKIYSYIDAFPKSRKQNERMKSGDWSFNNSNFWNLDADYLTPLKDFLTANVNINQ